MNSVGATLKTERERQGRETAEIADKLCITQRYLRAIEQDDLSSLPGSFFYKSFVKQYAAALGMDETLLNPGVDALTRTLEPPPLPGAGAKYATQRSEPPPLRDLDPIVREGNLRYLPDTRMGVPLAALVGMVLATSGFYAWYNKAPAAVQPVEAQPVAMQPAPTQDSAPTVAQAATAPPVSQAPPDDVAPKDQAQPSERTVDTAKPEITPVANVAAGADETNGVVLNLSATERTWLSITSNGKQIFSGVMEPSQTKTLTGLEGAKILVGNAAGLEVMWNGKPIGPIGPRGQVRVVLFTPENYQILTPNQAL